MIKGQDISMLMTINDTTSGRVCVWVMVIMLLILHIIYLVMYLKLEQYRYQKLIDLKNKLEFAISKQEYIESGKNKTMIDRTKKNEIQPEPARSDEEDAEDTEAMALFESLKSNRGW